ncbi:MAG: hypothetical protein CMJ78_11805 [Planctomycetaceae bacterium]|nr:hypothetical protein [Planctomycetaceae bacterium]
MSDPVFAELSQLQQSDGADATIDSLLAKLTEQKDYHRLFDAQLLKKKHSMGLPLARPTSFDDVPDDQRDDFEKAYIDAARDCGQRFLDDGNIPQAYMYFRTIREIEPVAEAIDKLNTRREPDESTEEILNIALYEGVNPCKGLEMMLHSHGTCNTVTAMDQQLAQLSDADRAKAAAMLVKNLYNDLKHSLKYDVEQRMTFAAQVDTIRELITGRDWLFEDGNYHIDVSHLNAVVRFARSFSGDHEDLDKAIELAEYGSKLSDQFQYGGEPPFDDFYTAHVHFFKAIKGTNVEDAMAYFNEKLEQEPDEPDKQLIAYVICDLMIRTNQLEAAVDLATQYLKDVEDPNGFSYAQLCQDSGRLDSLKSVAEEKGDLVTFTAALLQGAS